jgi:NAD+ synthase (glutamine-hydrolysing)
MPTDLTAHGFLRVAACAPRLALADPDANATHLLDVMRWAADRGAALLVTPETGLTGYTCHDLFHQQTLLAATLNALRRLLDAQAAGDVSPDLIALVGLPLVVKDRLFNVAAAIQGGRVLGVVPKTHLPNYGEFYDDRYFSAAREHFGPPEADLFGERVPFTPNLIFRAPNHPEFTFGIEVCEDAWAPIPRCAALATAGAKVIANLSASNELIGKAEYRREVVVKGHSATTVSGYVYAGAGTGESSTDTVFGGHCLVAENGSLLGESERFTFDSLVGVCHDLDLVRLAVERRRLTSFADTHPPQGECLTVATGPVRLQEE